MSANTIAINQAMTHFNDHASLWLFGYGSILYKVDFPYLEKKPARIFHWVRRFWQGSHDHRGTPEQPGRVVTLIKQTDAVCEGIAYRITPEEFAHLDHREKNGYLREKVEIVFDDDNRHMGITYVAPPGNEAYLGPATEQAIAKQIACSFGPSGPNSDYVFQLADALRQLKEQDQHVFSIEQHLRSFCNRSK